jgi:hypothetical protein
VARQVVIVKSLRFSAAIPSAAFAMNTTNTARRSLLVVVMQASSSIHARFETVFVAISTDTSVRSDEFSASLNDVISST